MLIVFPFLPNFSKIPESALEIQHTLIIKTIITEYDIPINITEDIVDLLISYNLVFSADDRAGNTQ